MIAALALSSWAACSYGCRCRDSRLLEERSRLRPVGAGQDAAVRSTPRIVHARGTTGAIYPAGTRVRGRLSQRTPESEEIETFEDDVSHGLPGRIVGCNLRGPDADSLLSDSDREYAMGEGLVATRVQDLDSGGLPIEEVYGDWVTSVRRDTVSPGLGIDAGQVCGVVFVDRPTTTEVARFARQYFGFWSRGEPMLEVLFVSLEGNEWKERPLYLCGSSHVYWRIEYLANRRAFRHMQGCAPE